MRCYLSEGLLLPYRMSERNVARAAYRSWAETQEYLPLHWQPRWLDLVAAGVWEASLVRDAAEEVVVAWPYCEARRGLLRWLSKPPHSFYGGPRFLAHTSETIRLPDGHGYGAFTVHQPEAAWTFGRQCRGMATQVIALDAVPAYDTDMLRSLRKAERDLALRPLSSAADLGVASVLLSERPVCGSTDALTVIAGAQSRGYGKLVGAYGAEDRLQGFVGVVYDGRRAYMPLLVRRIGAHSSTTAALVHHAVELAKEMHLVAFDMMSGYLPGVRHFHQRLGARPEWYGQVRVAQTPMWKGLEFIQSIRNDSRL